MTKTVAGQTNSLHDVAGLTVGHAQRIGDGWLTGTTCVLTGPEGAVGGVDVRGGGPGTCETDLLDPRNLVERVHAVVLTGGSAYGLASACGVMAHLEAAGVGFPIGEGLVPIVPAAVIFDLGRGGDFRARPDAAMGAAAAEAALAADPDAPVTQGNVGGGTGAKAGGLKGGVGSASAVLPDGTTVGALVVANPVGSAVDPTTGALYAAQFSLPGDFPAMGPADPAEVAEARRLAAERAEATGQPPYAMATTIGVLATDATLSKAQCQKLAGIGHDGLARAIRPVHTMFDGDTIFALSTTAREAPDAWGLHAILDAGADCVTRAVGRAVLAAESVSAAGITWRSYRDALPSVFRARS